MVRLLVMRLLVFGALLAAPLASLAEKPVEIKYSRQELEEKWRARIKLFLDRGVIPLIDLESSLKRRDGESYLDDAPQDVEEWLEVIGRAVATGRLSHHQGRTIATTVREWLKAHEAGKVREQVERLEKQLRAIQVPGDKRLRVAK